MAKSRKTAKPPKHRHFVASHPPSGGRISLLRVLSLATIILLAIAITQVATAWRLVSMPNGNTTQVTGRQQTTLGSLRKRANCFSGVILTVVAHQDDDLLFMNPHIEKAISSHACIRTVYITAGDDGRSARYWQSRERGIEAAYAFMYGMPSKWTSVAATVAGHPVEVAYLTGEPQIALTFLHLPDGNITGTGFSSHQDETLNRLREGSIRRIHTVDGSTSYTRNQLILALRAIMTTDIPDQINTQAYTAKIMSSDHSDHQAVGYFTDQAQKMYTTKHSLAFYLGYQLNGLPLNLSDADIYKKAEIFSVYSQYDATICTNQPDNPCPDENTYSNYFAREYAMQSPAAKHKH